MMGKNFGLSTKIMISLMLGIICGLLLYNIPPGQIRDTILLNGVFTFVGTGFIRVLKMVLVPVVFASLAYGSASMGDVGKLGRIGLKTIVFYLTTTVLAITIALLVARIINPGIGIDMSKLVKVVPTIKEGIPIVDVFLNIIPDNPYAAMANANMLQVIFWAIVVGVTASILGDKTPMITPLLGQINDLFLKITVGLMKIAPYAVFALVAKTFASLGYAAMLPLAKYMVAVFIGLILQAFGVYSILLKTFTRVKVASFFKNASPALTVGFSTASSAATLPVTLDTVEKRLGVSNKISSFTIPLGATVNMDGTAIMQGVAAVFVAQVFGVPLSLGAYITIIITATLASIGTAGVPGSGLIMLSMVLTSIGLPLEGIALIIGIDRILDMARTAVNIFGDMVCTFIIAKQENELDMVVFESENEK